MSNIRLLHPLYRIDCIVINKKSGKYRHPCKKFHRLEAEAQAKTQAKTQVKNLDFSNNKPILCLEAMIATNRLTASCCILSTQLCYTFLLPQRWLSAA